jgi:hypothetical protein
VSNDCFNICKGRAVELYNRVKSNDPANSALILVPLETSGLETVAVLIDKDDLAAVLSGTTNEQTTMGRKTLTDSDLATFPAPDDTNDRYEVSLPTVTWTAATGNAISKILVCYDSDTTSGTDSNMLPVCMFDCAVTPDGSDLQLTSGVYYRAS